MVHNHGHNSCRGNGYGQWRKIVHGLAGQGIVSPDPGLFCGSLRYSTLQRVILHVFDSMFRSAGTKLSMISGDGACVRRIVDCR